VNAFGVQLEGLPDVPFSLAGTVHRGPSLRWTHSAGHVDGDWFWERARDDLISIGWAKYASYEMHLSKEPGRVDATLAVDPVEGAVAFVTSVLPIALPWWGLEPLHGSAVMSARGALVVLGPSGAGKSSLAALLERRGFGFITDDASVFDESLLLWPGPAVVNPRWAGAEQPTVGDYNDKAIRVPFHHIVGPVAPAAVVVLDPAQGVHLEMHEPPLETRLRAILRNTRHGSFLLERRRDLQFRVATQLARLPNAAVRLDPQCHGPKAVMGALEGWFEREGIVADPARPPGPEGA
jgi:hypothetical protein